MRIDFDIIVEPGQPFVVDRFTPDDARGIAHLFHTEWRGGVSYHRNAEIFSPGRDEGCRHGNGPYARSGL